MNASEPRSTVHKRLGRVVIPLVLYMKEYSSDGVEGALHAIHQNNYAQFCKLDDIEINNIKMQLWELGWVADLITPAN